MGLLGVVQVGLRGERRVLGVVGMRGSQIDWR